jgi:hypothetical protein
MKFFVIAALAAGVFNPIQAAETATVYTAASTLSKAEITAILDIKTKQHIEIAPIMIQPLIAPAEFILIARDDTRIRNKSASIKILGDE